MIALGLEARSAPPASRYFSAFGVARHREAFGKFSVLPDLSGSQLRLEFIQSLVTPIFSTSRLLFSER
jgi:hypothetical protein